MSINSLANLLKYPLQFHFLVYYAIVYTISCKLN